MKRLLLSLCVAVSLVAPLACDLEQLTAENVMVGTLLSTPEVKVSPTAAAGVDGGIYTADGGEAMITIPSQTAALVFFGTRDGQGSSPINPIANATVTLQPAGGKAVNLSADGVGLYSRTNSGEGGELKYQPHTTYDFVVTSGGEKFVGRVEDAPPQEQVAALHPAEGIIRRNANQPFSFTRKTLAANEERTVGFVTVFPIGKDGERGDATYTDVPSDPLGLLSLVALPAEWKKDQVTIPATAFPERDQTYMIVFQTVRTGGPETSNLFIGSALLAGTADVGILQTNK
jgi:hypothetical protein